MVNGMKVRPRPYQVMLARAFAKTIQKNPAARTIATLPTGTGKTIAGLMIHHAMGGRTLWCAHREELIQQPYRAARALLPSDHDIGVVQANKDEVGAANLVIASVPTISRERRLSELQRYSKDNPYTLIVVDEAHHAYAQSYQRVLEAFPTTPVLGLTATPSRNDKEPLGEVFTEGICYRLSISDAIKGGYLVPPAPRRVICPEFHPDNIALNKWGDFNEIELAKEMLKEAAIEATVNAITDVAKEGLKILVFCVSVDQAKLVADECDERGIRARAIWGDMPKEKRRSVLRDHQESRIQVVTNFAVLTEGYDCTSIGCVVMARPTRSQPLYVQMCGRGLRCHCECGCISQCPPCSCAKKECVIVDLVGAHASHGLITADTLVNFKPPEELALPDTGEEEREDVGPDVKLDSTETASLRRFLLALAGDLDISSHVMFGASEKKICWSSVVKNRCYCLPAGKDGMLHVELVDENLGSWQTILEPKDKKGTPVALSEPTTKEFALVVGEDYARGNNLLALVDDDAPWRQQPASEGQLRALKAWHIKVPPNRVIRKGEASKLLSTAASRSRYRQRKKRPPQPFVAYSKEDWLAI